MVRSKAKELNIQNQKCLFLVYEETIRKEKKKKELRDGSLWCKKKIILNAHIVSVEYTFSMNFLRIPCTWASGKEETPGGVSVMTLRHLAWQWHCRTRVHGPWFPAQGLSYLLTTLSTWQEQNLHYD